MSSLVLIIGYLILTNIIGFALMGIDKRRARKNAFRIPEATLFSIAIIGGSLGSILGMLIFRHKTRHWYFMLGLPLILLIQILLVAVLFWLPISFSFI
ncbi:hypothetical protein bpr_I1815 [Butyrivibrio proteoclasticus B316]|uniref:DUF1294 domain-containing protein n=1 Tax=Butyrivibrio proteoclasticus (strain ATCC 51982 / DSM 14932 / B316) TaxID=515622 RepID=E0RVD1_BUTPB|nr:DUF1294 domain-containing protein [Butyrivibrio proteoclasticus]ADL34550.1 hypothetical protein bpr_I1815 [Butyrivibrio proteoclasticus B316]